MKENGVENEGNITEEGQKMEENEEKMKGE